MDNRTGGAPTGTPKKEKPPMFQGGDGRRKWTRPRGFVNKGKYIPFGNVAGRYLTAADFGVRMNDSDSEGEDATA